MDEERVSEEALESLAAQEAITDPQERQFASGTSSDAPGFDLPDAPDPRGPATTLDPDEPEPDPEFGLAGDSDDGT